MIEPIDRHTLRTRSYADSTNLKTRQSIYGYREPAREFVPWVLSHLPSEASGNVIDVGCGYGAYLRRLAGDARFHGLVGLDLSTGMLREAAAEGLAARLVCGDAARLPFLPGQFDVALAMHMLYHVEEPEDAVRELRRVVRAGGVVLVSTNGDGHLEEMWKVLEPAHVHVGGRPRVAQRHRFSLEDGEQVLARHFSSVERHDDAGVLRLPFSDPLVSFVDSIRSFRSDLADGAWAEVLADVARRVDAVIESEGEFRVTVHGGLLVARP